MQRYGTFRMKQGQTLGVVVAAIRELAESLGSDAKIMQIDVASFRDASTGDAVLDLRFEVETTV